MMNDDRENKALISAQKALDESVEQMPEDLSAQLAAMRAKAIASAENPEVAEEAGSDPKVVSIKSRLGRGLDRNRMVWSGAIAASCAALTLSFVLKQPGVGETPQFDSDDSLLILAEMDETEWELVQELEFALWLSEFGDEASATDFSG